jgi:hypothetical protein
MTTANVKNIFEVREEASLAAEKLFSVWAVCYSLHLVEKSSLDIIVELRSHCSNKMLDLIFMNEVLNVIHSLSAYYEAKLTKFQQRR